VDSDGTVEKLVVATEDKSVATEDKSVTTEDESAAIGDKSVDESSATSEVEERGLAGSTTRPSTG